ncbi:hypothetical protein OMP43_00645 [Sphingomonas sp. CBMAI 2297]|uniref:hypothetical protein n=1 Tax=Sphingomonas sp. CBMAI 2297 TaxID=2991720 RepID=UPI002453B021|nr:hypothetical protein [Sphingomonas sp. CBMAI 2297]MDH4742518.1 hypothetical protein [Sphingomonas sp. CBMAI 2297]
MKKLALAIVMLVALTLIFPIIMMSAIKPKEYACTWKKMSVIASPSGQKSALLYLTICDNESMVTFSTYNVFVIKNPDEKMFTPDRNDPRLTYSREANVNFPQVTWEDETVRIK